MSELLQGKHGVELVEAAARLLLRRCDGAISRDGVGYDWFDAVTVRELLKPGILGTGELEPEEGEYLRRKLLRYGDQLEEFALELGVSHDRIERVLGELEEPVADNRFIAHGTLEEGTSGRIGLKWLNEHSIEKSEA